MRHSHAQFAERNGTTALMATDAMSSLSFAALCDVVEAHIEARPDITPEQLHNLANKLSRRADIAEREV